MADHADNTQENALDEAVQQYIESQLKDEGLDIDEFVNKYPDLKHQIRQKIQNLQKIETLFDSFVRSDESEFESMEPECDLTGKKIGTFEIEKIIGRGGMGVVYLARDTKLGRFVAIKSMPFESQSESTAQGRLRREAMLLASLKHPNIAVIHDIIEQSDGSDYLVLEYVPGQTLAELIAQKSLKLQDVLSIGLQIAEALLGAYEQGITHRDLKPGNIKITPEGRVKVLDFGLAKASGCQADTNDIAVTQPGRIVGTPAYMSPEQVRGEAIDHRTDIWAFGCVMYEMLTGHIPFEGKTATDTAAYILEREPQWDDLPAKTPINIRVLIRRCMEKNSQERLQHIGDAIVELRETINLPAKEPPSVTPRATAQTYKRQHLTTISLLCLLLISTGLCILLWYQAVDTSKPDLRVRSYVINPRTSIAMEALWHQALAFSSDGELLAYVEQADDGRRKIYVRQMDSMVTVPLSGTEGAISPFFSPGADWIGYVDHFHKVLKKVSIKGGNPMVLASCRDFHGGSWSIDGTIVFAPEAGSGLWRISATGEGLTQLTVPDPDEGEYGHWWPQILPGGKAVLFTNRRGGKLDESQIETYSLENGRRNVLFKGGHCARYVSTGHLLYARRESLYAVRFDVSRLETTGDHIQIQSDVMASINGSSQFTIAEDGSFAYIPVVSRSTELIPVWVGGDGTIQPLGLPPRNYHSVRISPDGKFSAFSIKDGDDHDIWICDLSSPALSPLTSDGKSLWPAWFIDNKRIAFYSYSQGTSLWQYIDRSNKPEPISIDNPGHPLCCSPDGMELLFVINDPNHRDLGDDIWAVPFGIQENFTSRPVIQRNHDQRHGVYSPDGKWLAYSSEETGSWEVYVESYPGHGSRTAISTQGGIQPIWSKDGKELYYHSGNKIMAATIETAPEFTVLKKTILFEGNYIYCLNCQTYDVAPDGRFLMIQDPLEPASERINVVLNWFGELKRLVPVEE